MKYSVRVLVCDGQPDSVGDTFVLDGVQFKNPVPVTRGFQEGFRGDLGEANLRREDDGIYADIEIPDGILSLLPKEPLYPAVGGTILERDKGILKRTVINRIGLCDSPNADTRIGPLGP